MISRSLIFSILGGIILLLGVQSSVLENFYIPSESMLPTLRVGDQILVYKGAYRWKAPFIERRSEPVILKEKAGPERGDIIVFRYPRDLTTHYVKRVIGVSGDWVAIRDRQLYINDQAIPARELSGKDRSRLVRPEELGTFSVLEEKLEERTHLILQDREQVISQRYGPVVVPPGSVFVLGDHRDSSNDSRFWGFVPLAFIEGKALRAWLRFRLEFSPFEFRFDPFRSLQTL